MDSVSTEYKIRLGEDGTEVFRFELDERTFELRTPEVPDPPPWTQLSFKQCPHCPLSEQEHSHCPVALRLWDLVGRFHDTRSIDEVELEVITQERRIVQTLAIQRAIASILDLVLPACGCPITAHLRPLARFHLPLASEEETVFRVAGMYLLAQYLLGRNSENAGVELGGLTRIYEDLHVLNKAVSSRLQGATQSDSVKNAITLVDMYCMLVSVLLEDKLAEMGEFFGSYLPEAAGEPTAAHHLDEVKAFKREFLLATDAELREVDEGPAWLADVLGGEEADEAKPVETSESDDPKEKIIDEILSNSGLDLALEPMEVEEEDPVQPSVGEESPDSPRFYKNLFKMPSE